MLTDTSRSFLDRLQNAKSAHDWEVFCKIYQPFIRRHLLARKIEVDDVDDVTQEILARVFVAIASFTHNGRCGAFRKWLGKIVSQQTWQYFQAMQRRHVVSYTASGNLGESIPAPDDMESEWELEHDQYLIGRLLELVKPEFTETTWQAFQLLALENNSPEEASRQLDVSVNAIVIAKSRILRRLRMLGKDLIDSF